MASYNQATVEKKEGCPLEEKRRTEKVISKFMVSTTSHPDKGNAEGDLKKRCYNHFFFTNKSHMNITTLAKHISEL